MPTLKIVLFYSSNYSLSSTFRREAQPRVMDSADHRNPWLLSHSTLAESAPFSPRKKVQRSAALISSHVPLSPLSMSLTFSAYTLSPHPLWSSCPIHIPQCVCLYLKHCLCFLLYHSSILSFIGHDTSNSTH